MSGPQCCKNPPVITFDNNSGEDIKIASLSSYVSGTTDSKIAVVLISDIFGYRAPHLRQIADKVAAAGYYAVVPDFFFGDPYTSGSIDAWLKNHSTAQGFESAKPLIQALKEMGISKIGAAGFCWGAKVVVELAKEADIQVAAFLHPSYVTLDDINGVKIPIAILGAEIDTNAPPELIKKFESALEANKVDHFVKIFLGVGHGWTIRYDDNNAAAVKRAEEAHQDLLDWFAKQIPEKVAAAGYYVVVPDFFHGDPYTPEAGPIRDWTKNHSTEQGFESANPLIQALKEEIISKIAAAGFCWGGKVVAELAKADDIQVAAFLHPSLVTVDDIKGVKIPIEILGAEIDTMSPPELIKEFEATLEANQVDHFVKIFPGVEHGWTCRYDDDDATAVKSAEESHQDLWIGLPSVCRQTIRPCKSPNHVI